MPRSAAFTLLMMLALPAGALAQNAPADSAGRPIVESPAKSLATMADTTLRMEIRAERASTPIAVDGVLSEAIWQNGNAVVEFKQRDPVENGVPSQRTEVRVAYDDAALYIGAQMFDTAPDSIYQGLARRDNDVSADRFTVYLDPLCDRRTGYYFRVNASGTLVDGTLYNDGWSDDSWDGVWHAHVKRGENGWTTEMRIPFSQLRFASGEKPVWGINFSRCIMRHSEWDYVVFQPKQASGFVSRFPNLVGIQGVRAGRSVEIIPYVTSQLESFENDSDQSNNAGGDLRMGLGSQVSLVGTVNPDFGQVELDPAVVNLSDVETYFGEKRPFFVEGGNIFRFGNQGADNYWGFNWPEPTFFYSRRIGRTPTLGGFSGAPVATTILGAGKVTGKAAGMDFGTLLSATQREIVDGTEIEPLAFYGVARGLKSMNSGRQGFGIMGTAAARSFEDPALEDYLNRGSYFTGIDGWTFLDKEKMWVLSGWSGMSLIEGTSSRITNVQRNSLHYYQRPDAGHVEVDPNATSLFGHGTRVWLNKQKGSTFMNSAVGYMSQGFDVNDLGFQSRADVINFHTGGGRKWTNLTKVRKYTEFYGAVFGSLDFGGVMTSGGLYGGGFTEFANNWSWDYSGGYYPEHLSNRLTRGGPLMLTPTSTEVSTYFDTDGKRTRFYSINMNTSFSQNGSWYASAYPAIELKPTTSLKFVIGPGFEQVHENQQWVGNFNDATATNTFGARYVFALLDQTTVSANFRINAAFTPNLSLQFFAQPYLSAGDYQQFKELAQPRTRDFAVYGVDNGSTFDPVTGIADPDGPGPAAPIDIGNPDFNYVSLRGNMVMRWEYRPGSTFYLVWTQDRSDTQPTGDFDFGNDLERMNDTPARNIFLAKFTYHLGF